MNYHKTGGARARVWQQVLDRFDGSYIVRYKLFEHVQDMKIDIWYSSAKVGQAPYLLKGKLALNVMFMCVWGWLYLRAV